MTPNLRPSETEAKTQKESFRPLLLLISLSLALLVLAYQVGGPTYRYRYAPG